MKLHKVLLNLLFFFAIDVAYAAELTIYNRKTDNSVRVDVRWFNSWHNEEERRINGILAERSFHVSTHGAYAFTTLEWWDGRVAYKINIPSSKLMLRGVIEIGAQGHYSINFDKDGASDKKITVGVALPIRLPDEMK